MTLREELKAWWVKHENRLIRSRLARRDTLSFTRDFASANFASWTKHLAPLLGKPNLRALEIGCLQGRSTLWFLENLLTHPGSRITCVDPFLRRGAEPRFEHNIRIAGFLDKVTLLKCRSDLAMMRLQNERYDFVYVDGDHRAASVMLDAVQAWLLLKPSGIMIFDDYAWRPSEPADARPQLAIDTFLAAFEAQLDLLYKDYQVIVRKRALAPQAA
jgi:predicted O-methyltransferase YrrM